MKYLHLVWGALRRRPTRTVLTLLSIMTAFFLFGMLQGLNSGINSVFKLLDVAHLRVVSRVNMAAPLPVAHVARIAAVPGVAAVTGLTALVGTYQRPGNILQVYGVDMDQLFKVYSQLTVSSQALAAARRRRTAVIVGRQVAQKYGWKVGERIPVHSLNVARTDGTSDWDFDIVGIYDTKPSSWAVGIFANYDYINEGRAGGRNTVNTILVGISDPSRSAQISQQIDNLFANSPYQTRTRNEKDFVKSILSQIGDIDFIVNSIVGAVMFTLLFLTANTIAQSVRERIPELAVLKTLGFTDGAVHWLVLVEALLVSVVGAAAGLVAAALVLPVISQQPALQMGSMHIPAGVYAAGIGIAVLLALVSGLPPAQRARRLDIAGALSGR